MPTKVERLLLQRKKITIELNRLHDTVNACDNNTQTGQLVSYRKALETCWSNYIHINDEFERAKDSPCDEQYLSETDAANARYIKSQGLLKCLYSRRCNLWLEAESGLRPR